MPRKVFDLLYFVSPARGYLPARVGAHFFIHSSKGCNWEGTAPSSTVTLWAPRLAAAFAGAERAVNCVAVGAIPTVGEKWPTWSKAFHESPLSWLERGRP